VEKQGVLYANDYAGIRISNCK